MPEEQTVGNGLRTFSLHALDESSSGAIEQLQEERAAYPRFAPEGAESERDLDPETAARRYLGQALASVSPMSKKTARPSSIFRPRLTCTAGRRTRQRGMAEA